jgi:hypothetical protein
MEMKKMTVKLDKTEKQFCHDCISMIYILLSFLRLDNIYSMIAFVDLKIEQIGKKLKKISSG